MVVVSLERDVQPGTLGLGLPAPRRARVGSRRSPYPGRAARPVRCPPERRWPCGAWQGLPPGGGAPGPPVRREDPVGTAADGAQIAWRHDRVGRRDLKRHPVPGALPREPLLAPCRVPGDVTGDEHGTCRVAVASLITSATGSPRRNTRSPPRSRSPFRNAATESARNLARFGGTVSAGSATKSGTTWRVPRARRRQCRVVLYPQVTGEEHDGGVHYVTWVQVRP